MVLLRENVSRPALALVAIAWVEAAVAAVLLPDSIPLHWDRQGEVDRWGTPLYLLLFPFIMTMLGAFTWMTQTTELDSVKPRHIRLGQLVGTGLLFAVLQWVIAKSF